MKLYHTLPIDYFEEQMREDGFYTYYDRKWDQDITLGIWCCDESRSSWRAGQNKEQRCMIMCIDATDMHIDNQGDFLDKGNGDYIILREKFIPKERITIEYEETV